MDTVRVLLPPYLGRRRNRKVAGSPTYWIGNVGRNTVPIGKNIAGLDAWPATIGRALSWVNTCREHVIFVDKGHRYDRSHLL